ncbi:MAG: hypothetical protein JWP37_537 [Mucilaginibacter sp.]|nr:hypothetical protein [Mucilaginibacter sp.]
MLFFKKTNRQGLPLCNVLPNSYCLPDLLQFPGLYICLIKHIVILMRKSKGACIFQHIPLKCPGWIR